MSKDIKKTKWFGSDFGGTPSGGGCPPHKHKGELVLNQMGAGKQGMVIVIGKCPERRDVKGESKDKKLSKSDEGLANGENREETAVKTMYKQPISIFKKG